MNDIQSLRSEFDQDGFVILRGFFNKEELADLDTRTEAYLERGEFREKVFKTQKANRGTLKNLNATDPYFNDLLRKGAPAQTVSALLNEDIHPATAAFFDRIPGDDTGVLPHFDALKKQRRGATLWIALDKSSTENGCLYCVRGSHREEYEAVVGIPDFDKNSSDAVPIELEPGDASVHSALTVHWSNINTSSKHRRGVSFFYWSVE